MSRYTLKRSYPVCAILDYFGVPDYPHSWIHLPREGIASVQYSVVFHLATALEVVMSYFLGFDLERDNDHSTHRRLSIFFSFVVRVPSAYFGLSVIVVPFS